MPGRVTPARPGRGGSARRGRTWANPHRAARLTGWPRCCMIGRDVAAPFARSRRPARRPDRADRAVDRYEPGCSADPGGGVRGERRPGRAEPEHVSRRLFGQPVGLWSDRRSFRPPAAAPRWPRAVRRRRDRLRAERQHHPARAVASRARGRRLRWADPRPRCRPRPLPAPPRRADPLLYDAHHGGGAAARTDPRRLSVAAALARDLRCARADRAGRPRRDLVGPAGEHSLAQSSGDPASRAVAQPGRLLHPSCLRRLRLPRLLHILRPLFVHFGARLLC